MTFASTSRWFPALLLAAVSLAACKNDGAGPFVRDDRAPDNQVTGTGGGNSATGATGGTAASPATGNAAVTPGTSGAATATGGGTGQDSASGRATDTAGTPQPGTHPTVPSR